MAVTMAKANKKTYKKWVWAIIAALAELTDSLVRRGPIPGPSNSRHASTHTRPLQLSCNGKLF
jgi:hypothetical protein